MRKKKDAESGKARNRTLDQQGAQRRPGRAVPERGPAGRRPLPRVPLKSPAPGVRLRTSVCSSGAEPTRSSPHSCCGQTNTAAAPPPPPPSAPPPRVHAHGPPETRPPGPRPRLAPSRRRRPSGGRSRELGDRGCTWSAALRVPPWTQPRVLRRGEETQGPGERGGSFHPSSYRITESGSRMLYRVGCALHAFPHETEAAVRG